MSEGAAAWLDFEKPIVDIEQKIATLESVQKKSGVDMSEEIAKLREECAQKKREVFAKLTAWQQVQLARHPFRPEATDYIPLIFEDFAELHGDKSFGDDKAITTGLCRIGGRRVMLVAHCKGKTTKERMARNFGSPHPEGHRKALEKMKLAEKFRLPVITLVNTPGAYPGIGAEERGQAAIIARNLFEMSRLKTPIISIVIGEGGSGGALGICIADRLSMLEHAYLSVISPEGCAAILWRDSAKAPLAAELLRLTAPDLLHLGVINEIILEPLGGAHRDTQAAANLLKAALVRYLEELEGERLERLLEKRYDKYRKIGVFLEEESAKLAVTDEAKARP
ncbi:MAG: acetyl-CoA carboxylase carboxyltransferase subunit alpha [Planctomycetes bacterium]|nr:acetyl-CoA carboxylase carboxyltransferase subunit alpha [Planctomycetota bacterium]